MNAWEIALLAVAAVLMLGLLTFATAVVVVAWALNDAIRNETQSAAKFAAAWNPETKTFDGLEFRDGGWREVTR